MDRKASDSPPEALELFDGYAHGTLSRRDAEPDQGERWNP